MPGVSRKSPKIHHQYRPNRPLPDRAAVILRGAQWELLCVHNCAEWLRAPPAQLGGRPTSQPTTQAVAQACARREREESVAALPL
eukprot:COSAG02_NODE_3542_length_6588_cov_7.145015_3_plen_85_part_00